MNEYITFAKENWALILSGIFVLSTAIAAITPSDKDNTILQKIGKFFDTIGVKIKGKDGLIELLGKLVNLFRKKKS